MVIMLTLLKLVRRIFHKLVYGHVDTMSCFTNSIFSEFGGSEEVLLDLMNVTNRKGEEWDCQSLTVHGDLVYWVDL